MIDLGFILLLSAAAAGLGLALLDRLGGRPEDPIDALAMSIPLGLGALALAALGLGEVGALSRPSLAGLLGLGVVLGGCRAYGRTRRPLTPALSRGERGKENSLSPREKAGVRVFGNWLRLWWHARFCPVSLAFALVLA